MQSNETRSTRHNTTGHEKSGTAWLIFAATGFGAFMSALDAGIVVVALPSMAQSFDVDLSLVQWVLSAFLLSISIFLPLAGRLGDLYSGRRVFMVGLSIFTLASALCGMSQVMWHLVAARVVQAIGAALVMAIAPAIIMKAFPGKERGRALGLNATIVALGLLAGPGLGGLLIAHFGWPFIFFVNLPVGILGLVMCHFFLPREQSASSEPIDLVGAALFAIGMAALLIGVSHGNDWGWWAWPLAACGAVAALGLGAFYVVEQRASSPIIDLGVVSHPRFLLPSLAALIAYMSMYAVNILLPFYLHQKLVAPEVMGILLTVGPVIVVMVAPISGWLSEKINPAYLAAIGLVIVTMGLTAQSQLSDTSPLWRVALGQVLIGLGFGVFSSPNNNTILGSAPLEKSGLAGGLLALTRNLGMVCGIAMATSIFETVNALAASSGKSSFYPGFEMALLIAAGLALIAALLSVVRAWMGEETSSHRTIAEVSLENSIRAAPIPPSTGYIFTNPLAKGIARLTNRFKHKSDSFSYPNDRFMSIDVFRGFIMFWILGGDVITQALHQVSSSKIIEMLATQLEHKDWQGFYFYDLIFPSFIFIVGVSIVFSVGKIIESEGKYSALRKIVVRSLLLYIVGVIYYGGFSKLWPDIRLLGVLQRIAICYLAAGILFCFFKPRMLFGISIIILVGYWALLSFMPFPDVRPTPGTSIEISRATGFDDTSKLNMDSQIMIHGVYDQGVNLANYIDQKYLPGFKWDGSWDPEGILSTMPAMVTCIIGVLVGLFLKTKSRSEPGRLKLLIASGLLLILAGLLWNLQFPIIKKIWTSSYVLVAGGFSILFLSFFYYILDFRKWIYWAIPLIWIGTNSLTVYLADNFVDFHKVATFIAGGDIKNYLDETVTRGFGDLILAIISLLLAILFCRFLYQKAHNHREDSPSPCKNEMPLSPGASSLQGTQLQ
jgi:EmrB/QacA subfamily drug resistance transporter